jgi:hypothetical protein
MLGDGEILTIKELCDLLHIHPSTVYKAVSPVRFRASELAPIGDFART